MAFLKRRATNIYKLLQKKNYNKLIKFLTHKDKQIVDKAEAALLELVDDNRAWDIPTYKSNIEKLESINASQNRSVIGPLIEVLKKELATLKDVEEREKSLLDSFQQRINSEIFNKENMPTLTYDDLRIIYSIVDNDEHFDIYLPAAADVSWRMVGVHHFFTTKRIISMVDHSINHLPYESINSINKKMSSIEIIYNNNEMSFEIGNDQARLLGPQMTRFIYFDKNIISKFIPKVYRQIPPLYATIMRNMEEPCAHCWSNIDVGKDRCPFCDKIFYSQADLEEAKKIWEKLKIPDTPKDFQRLKISTDENESAWVCRCGTSNPINSSNCSKCGAFKANVAQISKW
jgi:hypothetical protein